MPTGKLQPIIENHADWILSLAFSPDGKRLITGSRDRTAKVYDLVAKESVFATDEHKTAVYAVAMLPDGMTGVSGAEDGNVRMWYVPPPDTGKKPDKKQPDKKKGRILGNHEGKTVLRMAYWVDPKGEAKSPLLASCGAGWHRQAFQSSDV